MESNQDSSDTTQRPQTLQDPACPSSSDLYSASIALITYEGQMIWNRYNVMLAANSAIAVLLGALVARDAPLTKLQLYGALGASLFCVALSWQWRLLTKAGWELQDSWVEHARAFASTGNPLVAHQKWRATHRASTGPDDAIGRAALGTIGLFMLAYVAVAAFCALALLNVA